MHTSSRLTQPALALQGERRRDGRGPRVRTRSVRGASIDPDPIPDLQLARNFIVDAQNTGFTDAQRTVAILKAFQMLVNAENDLVQ